MINPNTLGKKSEDKPKDLPEDFVGYFGTSGQPGHFLYILNDNELSYSEKDDWGRRFDGDWLMEHLSTTSFKVFWWKNVDVTILGYPRSLDDERPGSKSLFILKGNHVGDNEYIVNKMKEHPWVYEIFEKLADKYLRNRN